MAYSLKFWILQDKYFVSFYCCESFGLDCSDLWLWKCPPHQASSNIPRSLKCCHFCLPIDTYDYCLSCREAGKGHDPCVTNERLCNICTAFTEEQLLKIKHRHRYVRKQKVADTSKDDELNLLGDDVEAFSGSQADLEGAAENLFSSPPCPQPLHFEMLHLWKLPKLSYQRQAWLYLIRLKAN